MMKQYYFKIAFTILFLCSNAIQVIAQDINEKITISFSNTTIQDALDSIDAKTSYNVFYASDWLEGELVTGTYTESLVSEVLDDLLESTFLNYYITTDNKVIITQNNRIYDTLPPNFFGSPIRNETEQPIVIKEVKVPVFYNEPKALAPKKVATVRIGKETDTPSKNQYTLSGTIINNVDSTPLSNIVVAIEGTTLGTVTNEKGEYSLRLPPGVHLLKVQSLGFQQQIKRVVLYNDGVLDFDMNEALEGLDEVVVTGTVENTVVTTEMGTTKVDVEQIKNIPLVLGERDVFKVAATLPGIASAGEGAAGYNVRGGRTDQNLVLLDDAVIYNPAHFFGIFSAINPFTTKDLTVYKGHIPAKFGGRLASVFDITTKNATTSKFAGEASIGPVTSSLVLETPIVKDKAAIMLGARGTYSDIILRNLDEEELRKSQANFFDVNLKYNHEIDEKNSISASGYYSRDAFSITSDSLFRYSNRAVSLRWNHKFNEKHSGTAILTNTNYNFDVTFEGQRNDNFELGYAINETSLQLKMQNDFYDRHSINYGLESKLYKVQPGSIDPLGSESIVTPVAISEEQALESALYISDVFDLTEKLAIEGGVRLSAFTALGASSQNIYLENAPITETNLIGTEEFGNFEPIKTYIAPEFRMAGRYLFNPKFSIKGSINTQYQYIHQLTNNTTASPIDTWKLSDLNIKPQQGVQYALGFFHNFQENMFEASLESYYKQSKNVLDYRTGAQLLLNESIEQELLQGEGRSYGVELLLKKTKGALNGWVGYTYARSFLKLDGVLPSEQVNNGEFFRSNFDRPHDFSLVANYKITKRFSFSGNFVYQTGRPVTVPIGNFVVNNTEFVLFSDRNEFRVPDFYRLDLSFNVEGNHKKNKIAHSFWNISVYNVLGRNNPYSVFFVAEDGDVKAFQTSIFAVPIPTISYNIKF